MITESKINKAIDLLKKAEKIALKYDKDGFYLCFSGGKDSQCIYHLCKLAGVKFKAYYNVTTIDPPELLSFIKENYPDVIWVRPKMTFYNLIRKKKMLPTQKARYCCQYLKESNGEGKVCITGVRKDESIKRSKRESVEISGMKFRGTIDQFNAAFHTDEQGTFHKCINGKDKIIINPIINWTNNEVWSFIRYYIKVPYCCLYDKGKHRIGCLLCPMVTSKEMRKNLNDYPNFKNGILRVIKDLKSIWRKKGYLDFDDFSAEEILEMWITRKKKKEFILDKKQLKFDL